ncbi:putative glucan endo-1,3-beta-D-glucosidase [Dioscorea sansibarensis]
MARPEILLWVSLAAMLATADATTSLLGVNWGPMVSHPIDPKSVVKMLKANHITKVKLFDANSDTVNALAGTGIEVMLGIPNDQLDSLSKDYGNAEAWVRQNVTGFVSAKPAVNVTQDLKKCF